MPLQSVVKWFLFLSVGLAWIALDQLTKILIIENLRLGQTVPVIPNVLNWTYVSNPGAAFGFLGNMPDAFRNAFFLMVTPLAVVFIIFLMRSLVARDWLQILALASIFGGAMGNFIDRIRFRFVIDFIDIYFTDEVYLPAFNLADVAIVLGACSLIYCVFREVKRNPDDQKK